ncbi:LPXTG cell wall anchor domain-containing protein [Subtercola boreus]|nr:LPXTG cell wall anchor domain-containing protein [Subtercola boreus]
MKSELLTKGGLGGEEPDPSGGTPAVLLPGSPTGGIPTASLHGANSPARLAALANTGASSIDAGLLGGIAALSIGGLILAFARRRSSCRRRTS